jgi:beta-glucanase (GH16 family)
MLDSSPSTDLLWLSGEEFLLHERDDFDYHTLSRRWETIPTWGRRYHPKHQYQYYMDRLYDIDNDVIDLKTEVKELELEDDLGYHKFPYRVQMLFSYNWLLVKYGYIEFRCKMPNSLGTFPAGWMEGFKQWPPEIDIFEYNSSRETKGIYTINYFVRVNGEEQQLRAVKIHTMQDLDSNFHRYGVEWQPEYLKFYFDGICVGKYTWGVDHIDYPMQINLNSAMDKKTAYMADCETHFYCDYMKFFMCAASETFTS